MTVLANSAGRVTKYAAGQIPMTPDINGGTIDGAVIGGATRAAGSFTTVSATGQITSTVTTGTAPLVIASTTAVANLNASLLLGGTWAIPGSIGATTPNAGAFTTLSSSGLLTMTVGGKIPDNQNLTFGTDDDWAFGYDSALDAAVLVDDADNILFKIADLGTTAYPVFEAPALETHRAISTTGNEVSLRLSLNATDDDAVTAAEIRAQWTTNTLDAEVSRLSWYVRNTTLAEQMRLSGDGDLTVYGNTVYLDCDEATTTRFEVGGLAGQNREFRWSTSGSRRFAALVFGTESGSDAGGNFFLTAYNDSGTAIDNPLTINRAANGVLGLNRRTLIDTLTTAGDAALEIKQDDADEPFIKYTGTSAANADNNITTWTSGATLSGYVRNNINGTDYWMPYYTAPTS